MKKHVEYIIMSQKFIPNNAFKIDTRKTILGKHVCRTFDFNTFKTSKIQTFACIINLNFASHKEKQFDSTSIWLLLEKI